MFSLFKAKISKEEDAVPLLTTAKTVITSKISVETTNLTAETSKITAKTSKIAAVISKISVEISTKAEIISEVSKIIEEIIHDSTIEEEAISTIRDLEAEVFITTHRKTQGRTVSAE